MTAKKLSGWQLLGIFIVLFIVGAIVNGKVPQIIYDAISLIAIVVLIMSIVVGIQNFTTKHKAKDGPSKKTKRY